jgi:NAD(P)-dependent dehydrogenase (short-subunit alcohol dehydrogenase family)
VGKAAIVTGGGRDIGQAAAELLATVGARSCLSRCPLSGTPPPRVLPLTAALPCRGRGLYERGSQEKYFTLDCRPRWAGRPLCQVGRVLIQTVHVAGAASSNPAIRDALGAALQKVKKTSQCSSWDFGAGPYR